MVLQQADSNWVNLAKEFQPRVLTLDWDVVRTQLNKELTAVAAVVALFANYLAFHTALFADQNAQLGNLSTDAGAGVSQWDFFHGQNGWGFAVCRVYDYLLSGDQGVVVTITNQTPNLLTVNANCTGGSLTQ